MACLVRIRGALRTARVGVGGSSAHRSWESGLAQLRLQENLGSTPGPRKASRRRRQSRTRNVESHSWGVLLVHM